MIHRVPLAKLASLPYLFDDKWPFRSPSRLCGEFSPSLCYTLVNLSQKRDGQNFASVIERTVISLKKLFLEQVLRTQPRVQVSIEMERIAVAR